MDRVYRSMLYTLYCTVMFHWKKTSFNSLQILIPVTKESSFSTPFCNNLPKKISKQFSNCDLNILFYQIKTRTDLFENISYKLQNNRVDHVVNFLIFLVRKPLAGAHWFNEGTWVRFWKVGDANSAIQTIFGYWRSI